MKIKYIGLLLILLLIIFHNRIYINGYLNNEINNIYCEKIKDDLNEYKDSLLIYKNNKYLTKVKYRDIYNYRNELLVYKGYKDGVNKDLGVVDNNILVGVISKTYSNSSIVRLITNKDSKISIKINDNYGILKYNNRLYIDDIDGVVNLGDIVYTSGLGQIIENIKVGTVTNIIFDNNGINKIIEVEPFFNIHKLNYLYILGDIND